MKGVALVALGFTAAMLLSALLSLPNNGCSSVGAGRLP
jgi:hypothetical protein